MEFKTDTGNYFDLVSYTSKVMCGSLTPSTKNISKMLG